MGRKFLIVEDDADVADYVSRALREHGHVVDVANNGRDGLFLASDASYDLLILDRMLPAMDGLSVLKALRSAGVTAPALILSAMGALDDRIEGLEAGADDYLVKPFAFSELHARIGALLRRAENRAGPQEDTLLQVGDLQIDLLKRRAKRGTRLIDLKPREFSLVEFLARNAGRVVTRTMLLEQVWDYHFDPGTNVIDVHISRLRRKLETDAESPILHTVRGAGYRLEAA
jgi:two-component system, OmpR family, response regulator